MATLDSSIVNIALPTLTKAFNAELSQSRWVVIIYLVMITCSILPLGAIADQMGRKRIYQFGFFLFVVSSALCGLAQTLSYLVASRLLQGLGAAMIMANGPAIITAAVPREVRGQALGTLAMVVSAGLVSGPSLGGWLITHFGLSSIFWVNVPVGILGLILTQKHIQRDPPRRTEESEFDWAGTLLQAIALTSFLAMFDNSNRAIERRPFLAVLFVLSAFFFVRFEKRSENPIFDFSILKNRTFSSSNLASFFSFIAYSTITVLMPFYLEEVLHLSTVTSGFYMAAIPMTIFVVAPISGRLSDKMGSKGLSIAGAVVAGLTLSLSSGLFGSGITEHTLHWQVLVILACVGLSTGLFQTPNNNSIMSSAPTDQLGSASAFLATVRNLGLATGTGLATFLFDWKLGKTGSSINAIHFAFSIGSFASFAAMVASFSKENR